MVEQFSVDNHSDNNDESIPTYIPRRPGRGGRRGKRKGGPFREDLKKLMYGYGDDQNPNEASVELLETYVEEFVINLVAQSMRRSQRHHGTNYIRLADVLNVIKHDEKKFLRMPYILSTQQEINQTRQSLEQNVKFEDKETKKAIGEF